MTDRVHPFANGTDYMDWNAKNCDRCNKVVYDKDDQPVSACVLFNALMESMIEDGTVSAEYGKRLGMAPGKLHCGPCTERNCEQTRAETDALWDAAVRDGLIKPSCAEKAQPVQLVRDPGEDAEDRWNESQRQ